MYSLYETFSGWLVVKSELMVNKATSSVTAMRLLRVRTNIWCFCHVTKIPHFCHFVIWFYLFNQMHLLISKQFLCTQNRTVREWEKKHKQMHVLMNADEIGAGENTMYFSKGELSDSLELCTFGIPFAFRLPNAIRGRFIFHFSGD